MNTLPQSNYARRLLIETRAVELASDIGAKAHDLYAHGDPAAVMALRAVAEANPEMMAWLRDRLIDSIPPQKSHGVCANPTACNEACEDVDGVNYCLRCGRWEGTRR